MKKKKRENYYLSDEKIEELKILLLKEEQSIKNIIENTVKDYIAEMNRIKNRNDGAFDDFLAHHNKDLIKENRLYLNKIKKSLEKIRSGEYGICDECGSQIPFSKLKVHLTIDLCIVCREDEIEEEYRQGFWRSYYEEIKESKLLKKYNNADNKKGFLLNCFLVFWGLLVIYIFLF
ncbi:MAG: TraR/DksA family transcriptional regulator [Halobacteriovoraceae bacterium]|nr:TraR/DksA family transcriptional regulator [Halobacteriovoraceae bacterium]